MSMYFLIYLSNFPLQLLRQDSIVEAKCRIFFTLTIATLKELLKDTQLYSTIDGLFRVIQSSMFFSRDEEDEDDEDVSN